MKRSAEEVRRAGEGASAFRTLTSKLLAIYVPLVTVAALILFLMLEVTFYQKEREQVIASVNNVATIQSAGFQAAVWEYDVDQVDRLLKELVSLPHFQGAAVFDSSFKLMGKVGDILSEPENPEFRVNKPLLYTSGKDTETIGRLVLTVHSKQIWLDVIEHLKINAIILLVLMGSLVASTMFAVHVVIGRPLAQDPRAVEKFRRTGTSRPRLQ